MEIKKVSISNIYAESDKTEETIFSLRDLYNIKQATITTHDLFKVGFFLRKNLIIFPYK
jgi:hypothetical protein